MEASADSNDISIRTNTGKTSRVSAFAVLSRNERNVSTRINMCKLA